MFANDIDLGFWGQTFANRDIVVILLLVLLEGVLSIDNALVLGLLAKRVPKPLQKRALTYGLIGAFAFRVIAIATASYLLKWRIVKLLGGGYLVYIAVKHLFFESKEASDDTVTVDKEGELELRMAGTGNPLTAEQELMEIRERVPFPVPDDEPVVPGTASDPSAAAPVVADRRFWMSVAVIELTDIAFAVDSILAAIALADTSLSLQNLQNLPLWMVEGLAEFMSIGRVDSHTAMWMRDAVQQKDLPSLKDLEDMNKYFPYRWGQAFWAYISGTYGDAVIEPLFKNTATYGLEDALQIVLNTDSKTISNDWKRVLNETYSPYLGSLVLEGVGTSVANEKNAGRMNIAPSISPNGKLIAYISERNVISLDIYIANAETGKVIKHFNYQNLQPLWKSDNRKKYNKLN